MDDNYPVDARGYTDTAGASEYDGLSISWHNKARHFGTGPAYLKIGKAVRYSYAALDVFMAEQTRTQTDEIGAA